MVNILIQYQSLWLQGFLTTLKLVGSVVLLGVPVGILLGIVGGRHSSEVARLIRAARFVTKVIPVLVLLFWFHYPLQGLLGIVVNPFWTTVLTLGCINAIATAHVVTAELQLLPAVYREAGQTLGLSPRQILWHIELPLLVRRTLPQLLVGQAAMLEYTLFASLISVPELFRVAQTINAMVYQPVAIYSLLVLFFFVILAPLQILITWLQKQYVAEYS